MDSHILEFAKESVEKSEKFVDDPLVEFIILWIGFNALYNGFSTIGEYEPKKVIRYLGENKDIVKELLREEKIEIKSICDYIDKTDQHSKLRDYIKTRKAFLNPENNDSVDDFTGLIIQVRNNMFHAMKGWNQKEEENLLSKINPILKKLLEKLTNKEEI